MSKEVLIVDDNSDIRLLISNILNEDNYEKEINKNLKRNMPACIIYTSGTSGNPKGVVLSHGGILSNCEGAVELIKPLIEKKDPKFLTWLPYHIHMNTLFSSYKLLWEQKSIMQKV